MTRSPYKIINKFLGMVAISLLGYLIWDAFNTKPYVLKFNSIPSNFNVFDKKKDELEKLSFYIDKIKRRNIFLPKNVVIINAPEKKPEPIVPKIPISQLVSHLKVVGFSLGNPIMVMLENSKTKKTQFLVEGDTIDTDLTIKSVLGDSIVITNGIEDIKLK